MSRRVTTGASNDSPAATARMPSTSSSGRTSLRRNPLAPARSASTTYSSMSNVVSMRTRDRQPGSARMRRVASIPSTPGIRTSMSTMSGRVDATSVTASAPSSASPTTSRSGSVSRIIRRPRRTSAWSSAMRTASRPTSFTTAPPSAAPRRARTRRRRVAPPAATRRRPRCARACRRARSRRQRRHRHRRRRRHQPLPPASGPRTPGPSSTTSSRTASLSYAITTAA